MDRPYFSYSLVEQELVVSQGQYDLVHWRLAILGDGQVVTLNHGVSYPSGPSALVGWASSTHETQLPIYK